LGLPVVIAIALSVADELAFGVDRKFGCNAIALFRFSRKANAFSAHSAQVKAIANRSPTNVIAFLQFSQKLAHFYHI
jgi:hypothetical protein